MAFWKPIFAKAFDLVKTALGEAWLIAARHHALHQLDTESVNGTNLAEGCHGTAQAIGLIRCETTSHNGNFHSLFLEEWYAQGLAQNRFQLL